MPEVCPETLVVEKCPDYLVHPDAPKRAFELVPDAKIIMIARDPVERAISDYCQLEDEYIQRYINLIFLRFILH
jgi:Sulfotransferase family